MLGGMLFKHSAVTCGAAAVEAAQAVNADLFFLGVTGVHPDAGLTTGDADEAAMKRALSRRAADTYVLGSAEKIGAASAVHRPRARRRRRHHHRRAGHRSRAGAAGRRPAWR